MLAFVVLLTTPQTTTAIRNLDIIPLSDIMLAEAYGQQLGCRKCGEKCGPAYWCCSGCRCGFNVWIGEFRCSK
ncbi:Conotoxin Bu2 [Bienertia sinuspersici]